MSERAEGPSSHRRWPWIAAAAAAVVMLLAVANGASLGALKFLSSSTGMCAALTARSAAAPDQPDVAASAAGTWVDPLVGQVASVYGWRIHPVTGRRSFHSGEDVAAPSRTQIRAAARGRVVHVGWVDKWYGNEVAIDHGGGVTTHYRHLWDDSMYVGEGDTVQAGQVIAGVGSTGTSTGPHLHFEVHVNGKPTNPTQFLAARGVTLGESRTTPGKSDKAPAAADLAQPDVPPAAAGTAASPSKLTVKDANGDPVSLNATQLRYASQIIGIGQNLHLSTRYQKAALMTVLQESQLLMYANSTVPQSLQYPHDAVGHDHDSVGLAQQRPSSGWGSVKQLMQVDYSIRMLYGGPSKPRKNGPPGMLNIPGHATLPLDQLAQRTQVSKFPDAYRRWAPVADAILAAVTGTASATASNDMCTPGQATGRAAAAQPIAGDIPQSTRNTGTEAHLKPHTIAAKRAVAAQFPQITTIDGWRPNDPYPDHPSGHAIDVMIPNYTSASGRKLGSEIAGWARTNATKLNITYIIYDQHIWNVQRDAEGWRPMADRGSDAANHTNHVHLTLHD